VKSTTSRAGAIHAESRRKAHACYFARTSGSFTSAVSHRNSQRSTR
jgi:hypothetical protein